MGNIKNKLIPSGWKYNTISNKFILGRGRVISENEISNSEGIYPVFSSQTTKKGEFGRISSYDFEGEYITWTTDGANAGTVFYRNGKFNCTNVCGTLKAKSNNISTKFFSYLFSIEAKNHVSYIGNPKLMNNVVSGIVLMYPSSFFEQKKIAEILETVDEEIEKTDEIIKKYERIKKGLMQDLFSKGITAFQFEKDKIIQVVNEAFTNGDHKFGREENIVSHLKNYLREQFPDWTIDGEVEKNNRRQRPDIIIHERGTDENLFAIEVKKNGDIGAIKQDIKKLEEVMLGDYHYEDAVFIGFDIENEKDIFKLSDNINYILVSENGEIKTKSRIRKFKDSPIGKIPEEWDIKEIKDIAEHINKSFNTNLDLPVLSCTKYDGLVDSLEYFKRKVYSDNLSKYKIVEKEFFAYATNHIEEGSIGYQDIYDLALISPMYTVFKINCNYVNNLYLFRLLKTEKYRLVYENKTEASVNRRGGLRWNSFSEIKFTLPPLLEQSNIVKVFSKIDESLENEKQYKQKLERIKQGLMDDLLTGKVRVNHLIEEDN